jgi:hypothetical protein
VSARHKERYGHRDQFSRLLKLSWLGKYQLFLFLNCLQIEWPWKIRGKDLSRALLPFSFCAGSADLEACPQESTR